MVAATPHAKNHDELAPLFSRFVEVDDIPWETTRFPGIEIKTLLEDAESGLLTTLVKMAPGARLPEHEHTRIEQTYVLEGHLVDDDGEVSAGNFVWRPEGSRHSAHSPNGSLMIAFFLKPNRFFDQDRPRDGFEAKVVDSRAPRAPMSP